jgi:nitrogenase iron protein NifH
MTAKRIAFYGQPGTGTTTIVTNLGASLAEAGHRVAIVGCAADGRDTVSLHQGRSVPTVLDLLRVTTKIKLEQITVPGFKGILCAAIGKVTESVQASVALTVVSELLSQAAQVDYLLFDATGPTGDPLDFVRPLLEDRLVDQLVAVSTAEVDSLRAANRVLALAQSIDEDHNTEVAGIIGNKLHAPYTEAIIDSFARETSISVVGFIPLSLAVTRSAFFGASLIDAAPLAHHGYLFRKAAKHLITSRPFSQKRYPLALADESFNEWALDWGERLYDLGEGYVGTGGGI